MSPTLKKIAMRAALFGTLGLALIQMLPSLAEQLTPDPSIEAPLSTESPQPSPDPTDSLTATSEPSPEPTAEITYLSSESPTAKAKVIAAPALFFRTPNSVQVDPRATFLRFNSVALGGAANILVCISSTSAAMTIQPNSGVLISGQGTRNLLISGNSDEVLSSLTLGTGLTFQGTSKISGSGIIFEVAALSKPAVDPLLCVAPQFSRFVAVTPLGIDLNIVKAPVDLSKKQTSR